MSGLHEESNEEFSKKQKQILKEKAKKDKYDKKIRDQSWFEEIV